ncbi:MAG: C25 family cysteine peptidase [Candidatus Krumholzibacteriia bacterium]
MRKPSILLVIGLLLVVAPDASADVRPVELSEAVSEVVLTSASPGGLSFRVRVGELGAMDVTTSEGDYTRLLIPGFHSSHDVGAPELPMMNRLIALPLGAEVDIEVSAVQTRRYLLSDLGVRHPLMPAQPSVSKSQDPAQVPFVLDRAAYQKALVSRPLAVLAGESTLRAVRFGRLELAPVTYFPQSGEIEVAESFEVTVRFRGGDQMAQQDLIARTWSPFFEPLYDRLAGAKGLHDSHPDRVADVVTMVIITPPEFEATLQEFIAWKTLRGFRVIVGVIGTPAVGSTTTSIQSYIHGLYNGATPEQPAPSFALFVGDVAQCPTFTLSGDATDRPYCAVDGDLVPDIYYGRFSATSTAQLQAIIDKTLMYDRFTMPDPSYLDEVVMIAGVDATWAPTHGNGQINYGTEHYFNAAHGLLSHTYLYPTSSGPVEGEIVQHVSDGVAYINYTAHGSVTSWADPSFTQANVNGLTNAGKYCLAVGNCCVTSTYDEPECFAETWLRAANKGSVGYIGGSNSTYWDEDYWWGVGFHPAGEIDGTAWPYASTGLGAYDGVFHDHGEAAAQWYVTNDAIIFAGNLAVHESGSSRTTYYWNIYNLMGDPSLSTYLGVPATNPVTHPATVLAGQTEIAIGAAAGSYVGLTQGGELVGAGTVDDAGSVAVTYLRTLTPGVPLHLVVMAQNREPYVTDLDVIVPATVLIDPTTIPANTTTDITVTVLDATGMNPQPGIEVWAEGLDYQTAAVTTDAGGVAVITVNYAYGPSLDIVGQDPAETYRLFTEPVTVTALPLTSPDLAVSTDFGLSDAFALDLPGTLQASVGETGHTLYARLPDGSLLSTTEAALTLTPAQLGQVTGIIAVGGHDLYSEAFDVIEAHGTLSGTVTSGGAPLAGVVVTGLDAAMSETFSVTTDGSGAWTVPDDLLVGDHTVVVDHFGYLHHEAPYFVRCGANTLDIALVPAPSGVLSGRLTDSATSAGLVGTVRVYRSDTGELYDEAVSDANGDYVTGPLPYFTYQLQARAPHHVPVTIALTLEDPAVIKDFILEPTTGDLLIVDDGGAAAATAVPAKYDEKTGELIAPEYLPSAGKSADQLRLDLEAMGYYVTVVAAGAVDPAVFWDHDLVILSCGGNTATLRNAALKSALVTFAQAGGHLLLEGGELGYNHYQTGDFAAHVMHTDDWNHDGCGQVTIDVTDHRVVNVPNVLSGQISLAYSGYGDSDGMVPLPDAVQVASWSNYPSEASVICYDPNPVPDGGQIVYFTFNYLAAGAQRIELLENAVHWLLADELGTASVSGTVTLAGQSVHAGITVAAVPGGGTTVTDSDGSYTLDGLFAGSYAITASMAGWSTARTDVTLVDGEHLTGVDLQLSPVATVEACSSPGAPIGDHQTFIDVVGCPDAHIITAVEVWVDITHTYIGDLTVTLTSARGTDVVLHARSGGSADDLVGWYPATLTPAGDLDLLIGEEMQGDWTLTVSDGAGGDVGALNEWCVRLTYAVVVGIEDRAPRAVMLEGNHPNPFNPSTTITFAVPVRGRVDLQVFDLRGRLVATLANGSLDAGHHSVTWQGCDAAGRAVPSGTYVYRLQAGGETRTAKMMLVR